MTGNRVLIIAQTPPPFHGQAIMQQYLVEANWPWCKKEFVRMNFSEQVSEIGVFRFRKISQLFNLVNHVRRKSKPRFELAYYPPGGPHRIPVYRDIVILFFLRLTSCKIILHFHAGGIDQLFNKVTRFESYIIKKAFKNVDAIIVLTDWLKKEVEWCEPKKYFVVGNGIEDVFANFPVKRGQNDYISFLFVGNLKKEKGIFTLLRAAKVLKEQGEKFIVKFIGSFHSEAERESFFGFITGNGLQHHIQFLDFKNGNDKWDEFSSADIFCLPTYETEAMPISILEAMMFQMPVITTRWRSIPDLIRHEENGLLFEPEDANQLAACMQRLIHAGEDRKVMGLQARKDYLQNFTVEEHLKKMENVFREVLNF